MSKISIPEEHLKIFRRVYKYLADIPPEKMPISLLGNLPISMQLEENLLRNYRKNAKKPTDTPASENRPNTMQKLHESIYSCPDCDLAKRRKQSAQLPKLTHANIVILSDIASFNDQLSGRYFSDAAGSIFRNIIKALGLDISTVYYTACIKCSSTVEISNRLETLSVCLKHLNAEIALLQPKLILAFGLDSFLLLQNQEQGKNFEKQDFLNQAGRILKYKNIDIVFTHHPREMLYDAALKKQTWEHVKPLRDIIQKMQT